LINHRRHFQNQTKTTVKMTISQSCVSDRFDCCACGGSVWSYLRALQVTFTLTQHPHSGIWLNL